MTAATARQTLLETRLLAGRRPASLNPHVDHLA